MNSLAAMLYVLSLLFYVKFRMTADGRLKWPLLAGCVFSGLMALGTKEIAVTLPVFIFLYEWYFFQKLNLQWARRYFLIPVGLAVLSVVLSLVYLDYDPIAVILSSYKHRDFTLSQRLLTEPRVVIFYVSLLLWPRPSRLNLEHDFAVSHSLVDPLTTMLSIAAIAILIVAAVFFARKEPLLSFGILWFFGNLAIESSFIGLELVFEHRTYLPSMVVILGIVSVIFRYLKPGWAGVIFLCIVGTLFSAWTVERNRVWADDVVLYQDCVRKSPNKARAHNNLGTALSLRGRLPEAIRHYQTAIKIEPGYADAHYNLGYALVKQGNLEKGIYHFLETLRIRPRHVKALNNIGVALALKGNYRQAIEYFRKSLKLYPRDPDTLNNIGSALSRQGDLDAAGQHFIRALAIDSEHKDAHNNLGLVLMREGQLDAAHRQFTRALKIDPNFAEARRNLQDLERKLSGRK
jgi:Tfp pilus assembly protein PilF